MADEYVIAQERIYSAEEGRPRYVVAYEGQRVKRSVLEALGYAAPAVEAKRRPRKTVEDKAVKSPARKGQEEA
jgi:hypothetical protein